jgi:nucleotide-binding universal stress UspA family protein
MYQRIVVPLDGSTTAEQALPEAERMARLAGAPVHLVGVVDVAQIPWYGQVGMAMEYAAVEQALADECAIASIYLQTIAERLTASGLTADVEVRRGHTAAELEAAAKPGDLFVMASHGRSGITRWLLGSVAEALLRNAPVPILLIKAGPPEAGTSSSIATPPLAAVNGSVAS